MEAWILGTVVILGILIILILCTFLIIYYCFPEYIIKLALRIRQMRAKMKIRYIGDEDMMFCYGERGTPSPDKTSIVFVHGFTSSKDQWVPIFRNLPADLYLVALDLPGHGASSTPGEEIELSLEYIENTFNRFLDLMGLLDRKVHLAGASLGGAIVGVYAAHHPERVKKVTLVCPPFDTLTDTDFTLELKRVIGMDVENLSTKDCRLLPTDVDELKALFELFCYNKELMKFSDQIWKGLLTLYAQKTEFYLRLYKILIAGENFGLLEKLAPEIICPSQVIWGMQDEIIHVSGAELLRTRLPNCKRVDIIDQCGHVIDIDKPELFTKCLLKFIGDDFSQESTGHHV